MSVGLIQWDFIHNWLFVNRNCKIGGENSAYLPKPVEEEQVRSRVFIRLRSGNTLVKPQGTPL